MCAALWVGLQRFGDRGIEAETHGGNVILAIWSSSLIGEEGSLNLRADGGVS